MPHGGSHSSMKRSGVFPCEKMCFLSVQSGEPGVGSAPHDRGRRLRDAGVLEGAAVVQDVRRARDW